MTSNFRQYSVANKFYMAYCLLRTRLFYPGVKIIRFPFDVRNSRNIYLGKNVSIGHMCHIEVANELPDDKRKKLIIGDNTRINDFAHIAALESVKIGTDCGIGPRCCITDINHGDFTENTEFDICVPHRFRPLISKPVSIGNNVWIGANCCICPGVTIGDYSVIGAASNVVKSIPPYSMAVGNPAKVIKRYNLKTRCWERV